ncbi:hypothetical protein BAUCODRAFT_151542 [Baudoinia panamericana UAMH 10762]|uniref:PLD phosphodiesterase domain-containing protein n=1 Tax=Baudoinia panamericana (strain UAMH 10762) TaxID=717646 RepID=M2N0G6_BAUPA|nr:uncharacterized protein BAUCODRAFT_151542 [Baudoinia panamericana UAMH 10762]EMC92090.1 hypothetical protein BAUCODRAFT_151542 [Baudoinia panamericana UAMH 10762]
MASTIDEETIAQLQAPEVVNATANSLTYYRSQPGNLRSYSNVESVSLGTGYSIYSSTILPAIRSTDFELILVTCFWARSATLDALNDALLELSAKGLSQERKIRIRICFSSSSLLQKLLHTQSLRGQTWTPSTWKSKLGLPAASELSGLDMEVISIFQLPFSVMHPKFVIVDRKRVLLPSCNVSWEEWFEGCVSLTGAVTEQFLTFWLNFWADENIAELPPVTQERETSSPLVADGSTNRLLAVRMLSGQDVPSTLLPSPHQRFNLPWLSSSAAPPTPLNIYLLTLFARAKRSIYIQTPNFTAEPVSTAVFGCLARGVDVSIVTSRKLMRLEQLVTAGTTTHRCVSELVERYMRLHEQVKAARTDTDAETGLVPRAVGQLIVNYYKPRNECDHEPVQSHLKLTIADQEIAVFGSGNMDRASWYTSQELGLALRSRKLVDDIWHCLQQAMADRTTTVYSSA